METEQKQTKRTAPRWMRVLLVGSLAVNLLVIGLVGGAIARFGGVNGFEGLRAPPRTIGAVIFRELPGEDRRALWNGNNGTARNHHKRQMDDAKAVSAAVRATPFDRSVLSVILEDQAARRRVFRSSVQQDWMDRVAEMSEPDRQAYARRLEKAMSRPWFGDRPPKPEKQTP